MKCIYINCKEHNWLEDIFNGTKDIETRRNRCLFPLLAERVGLIRTGCGPAELVGECTIIGQKEYKNELEFCQDFERHRVPSGSHFSRNKVGYSFCVVFEYEIPIPLKNLPVKRHGYDWCEILSFSYDDLDSMRYGSECGSDVSNAADQARWEIECANEDHPDLVPEPYDAGEHDMRGDDYEMGISEKYDMRFDMNGYLLSINGKAV